MELPPNLKAAIDTLVEGLSVRDLETASSRLSERYRAEKRDGRLHLSDAMLAHAYLATRLPATFAAARASFEHVADRLPNFTPHTQLDAGSGPGTAYFAAQDCWPEMQSATLMETSASIRAVGSQLVERAGQVDVTWQNADLGRQFPDTGSADLVSLCYVLNELSPEQDEKLVAALWDHCTGVLVIVEPGTPEGWKRLMRHRSQLIQSGGTVIAPCSHQMACPLTEPDWCHFSQRVARSKLHRTAKGATVPYEDEKFAFLAVARSPNKDLKSRVIARAQHGSGKSTLKLCQPDGSVVETMFTKRDGAAYKRARKLEWGDVFPPEATGDDD